jgi:oxygen-independent coproporphyrinogen-3 oxidase
VAALRRLGFSRISFGIQDADPAVQRAVNRVIATDQLRRAMGWMREAGFASVNVDLICGLPLQTLERFGATLDLVRDLRPERISLFSFAYLPEQLPMQRHIAATDLPSRAERLQMLEEASRRLGAAGYEAISQFRHLSSQNERNLWAWQRAVAEGRLPVERGVRVDDPLVLQRRAIIRDLMCRFQVELPAEGFEEEWAELAALQADGLVRCHPMPGRRVEVSEVGRWLIRTVAAVFDPAQRQRACGSRLL